MLLSLGLPEQGGQEICREIRRRPMGALVPILLLGSGREEIASLPEALAIGADHFFLKPQELGLLFERMSHFMSNPEEKQEEQTTPPSIEPARRPQKSNTPAWLSSKSEPWKPSKSSPPLSSQARRRPSSIPALSPPLPESEPWELEQERRSIDSEGSWGRLLEPPQTPQESTDDWLAALEPGQSLSLSQRSFALLLALVWRARFGGRLELTSGGILRRIFFDAGRPVFADSSATSEDLAAYLAAEGRIARSVLTPARRRAQQVGAPTEEVLIEAGFLRPEDVYHALRGHLLERLSQFFSLEAGEALVIPGGSKPLDPVDLGVHPGRIILDGVRRKYGRLRLYRAFGTGSAQPQPRLGQALPSGLRLRPDEEAVLRAVDGRRSTTEIAQQLRQGEVDTLAILFALGILDLIQPPRGCPISPLPPLGSGAVERAGSPRSAEQMPGYADLVGAKLLEVRNTDYFQLLEISPEASEAEVKAAWRKIKQRFDPHRVRRDGPLWAQVKEICQVVDDAYAILSQDRLRQRYQRALFKP